ncbi:MAG TPA: nucleoside-diphosphate sugar epimerase/dehydratase [Actinomycetota bacterium]|nr:nucleoside-diphosphate sugar epimerase/dehydratase [Actinomycetota bacterium]
MTRSVHDSPKGRFWFRAKFATDLTIWTLAALVAFPLRAPNRIGEMWTLIPLYALAGMSIKAVLLLAFGLPRQAWERVTIEDLLRVVGAVVTGTAVLFGIGLVWYARAGLFPRTVPLIEGVVALVGMSAIRVLARLYAERQWRLQTKTSLHRAGPRRVLLVGAGDAGTRLGWEIRRHPDHGKELVGYLDDDPVKRRLKIAGTDVLGGIDDLPQVVKEHQVDEVLISMPAAGGRATKRVVDVASAADVPCRILPGVTQVLLGEAQLAGLRPVKVEDLLRRKPVPLDLPPSYLEGRTALVTGAGGSVGSELVRQIASAGPGKVILFGHGENTLHDIGRELQNTLPELDFTIVVGDIRDRIKVLNVMERFRPSVVFHAAAHKHVPLMEADPDEAILNNVAGTRNVAEAALAAGVTRFVNVSTDKAVHPASMLGVTKHLAERIVRMVGAHAEQDQVFASVRFGNVLGSRGSVVPIFEEQIRTGGPIKLTDRRMTRYFMTIPEASRLVVEAGALGVNGAVYVLDMGTPVLILDLAKEMIRLAGADEDDVKIRYTGLRPGEKLHEELFTHEEELSGTTFEHIMMATHECDEDEEGRAMIEELIGAAERRDWWKLDECLRLLVPDFPQVGLAPPPVETTPRIVVRTSEPEPMLDLSHAAPDAIVTTVPPDAAG